MAAYPKTVTLRADRRVCSNSLLTEHFVFVFVTVLIFVVLFHAGTAHVSLIGLVYAYVFVCVIFVCLDAYAYVLITVIFLGDYFMVLPS